jgi:formate dehydrogenase accessory protein FdhE
MTQPDWDRRLRRSRDLIARYPFAAEGLRFYEAVTTFQRGFYWRIEAALGSAKTPCALGALRDELDLFLLLPAFSDFLNTIRQAAPAPLGHVVAQLIDSDRQRWERVIRLFWNAPSIEPESPADGFAEAQLPSGARQSNAESLLAWIFLQPYAEYIANHRAFSAPEKTPSNCPLCGSRPVIGVLRPEGEGGRKSLVCMLCAHEWPFRRIFCPSCGEDSELRMAVYTAAEFDHVRVDACESCKTYLKTVDLTKSGLAVPVVDELAAIPLDLWAQERGYTKLQRNLLGI